MIQKNDWTTEDISAIYHRPLLGLIFEAAAVHRTAGSFGQVQVSSLLSVKTGGCSEDCAYCPQAARYSTGLAVEPLLPLEQVIARAQLARSDGATRFCMGAAWREVRDNRDFDRILEMVRSVSSLGMEVCCTLGMLTRQQAVRLKEAGCYAYNHNIDSSPAYYSQVITTRSFADRIRTLDHVRQADLSVCCGGIIGMGETVEDRIGLLHTLATMQPHPDSVPVNLLVPVPGTPLGDAGQVPLDELLRMIATARILMPASMVRLSAGRRGLDMAAQALCFMAGANSIFAGEKLLTTPNPDIDSDQQLFRTLGLTTRPAFRQPVPAAGMGQNQPCL